MINRRGIIIFLILGTFFLTQYLESTDTLKRLTWNSGYSCIPTIAVDSNNHLHVVWYDDTPGNKEIFYKQSTDGGATWSAPKRLTWNSGESEDPIIAIDSNNHIYVVWHNSVSGNYEIFYKKSTDSGANWSTKRLTWNSGYSYDPAITIDSNNHIHVVWDDSTHGNDELFYKQSTDGGATWTAPKRLTWNSGFSVCPAIAVGYNNHIHVVWHDSTPGNYEIFYKHSTDDGANWSAPKRLSWTSGWSEYSSIAIDSNNHLHVVWDDHISGNNDLFYKKSTDGGATWIFKRLTWTSGASWGPSIVIDTNNHIHIVWSDSNPGNDEIFYKESRDGGTNWTAPKRLTWNSGYSWFPAIAVDFTDNSHVVWQDWTPGIPEIFYTKFKYVHILQKLAAAEK
jgi:hypothetical protein